MSKRTAKCKVRFFMLRVWSVSQKVALQATVAIPQMMLSKSELDFGTCLVGQRREMQLLISNSTAAHCRWVASFGESLSPFSSSLYQWLVSKILMVCWQTKTNPDLVFSPLPMVSVKNTDDLLADENKPRSCFFPCTSG